MTRKSATATMSAQPAERGRPREFDLDEVVERAGQVFWQQGYHATSVESLCQATGLFRASLYGAFGDKHGVLIAAFDRYADNVVARVDATLKQPGSARARIREALRFYTELSPDLAVRRGCLITNTVLEMLPGDTSLRPHLEAALGRIAALYAGAIARGQEAGEFDASVDPNAAARFMLCTIQGLRVLGKTHLGSAELADIVELALRALDPPARLQRSATKN
jgi:TetR/AcrR family transcriptional regulator, transcriptional repressor for nem operon